MKYIQIIMFLLVILTLVGIGHASIYYAIKTAIILTSKQEQNLIWILIGLSVSFIIMSIVVRFIYHPIISVIYTTAAVWLGTVYWLFLASVIIVLFVGINRLVGGAIPIAILGKLLLLLGLGVSIYGVRNSNQTKIVNYTVPMKNLPVSWENKKIAMIADTHVGAVRNVGLLHRIRPLIEGQGVQMLLVAGDFYDGVAGNDAELAQALAQIQTPRGTYFAPGNHEEYNNLHQYLSHLSQTGIHVLNNQVVMVDGLQLIGVDYSNTKTSGDLSAVLSKLDIKPSQPTILIKHVPNNPEIVDQFGIDLQVAGHVHQGQIWPGYLLARKVFGVFSYGLNAIGNSWIITTSGVGTRGPPQRVGTQSEIVIITLTKKINKE